MLLASLCVLMLFALLSALLRQETARRGRSFVPRLEQLETRLAPATANEVVVPNADGRLEAFKINSADSQV
jgi:hypothetical protein